MTRPRQGFGIPALETHLGGGLIPGTLTVVAGATGAGKTQLGLHWAHAGHAAEGRRGVICDLTSRGDAQNHAGYARDLFGWQLAEFHEQVIDDRWVKVKPTWAAYRDIPISFACVWRR